MCESTGIQCAERDELMALIKGLQERVAGVEGGQRRVAEATRRVPAGRKAPGVSVLEGQAKQQAQASWPQAGYGVVQLPQAALCQ